MSRHVAESDDVPALAALPLRATELRDVGSNVFEAELPPEWVALQGVHGGFVASLAVRAVEHVLADPARTLRAATFGFLRGVRPGRARFHVDAVPFAEYHDRRWDEERVEGDLGLSMFKNYDVAADWDAETFYVWPRAEQPPATRIGRWQSKTLTSCAHVGCATVTMIDPLAGKPLTGPHPGLVVTVTRDASASQLPLEVVISVTGKPGLSWLVASLPAGADRAMTHVSADYLGTTAQVVDASPFPRTCPGDGGCIDKLAPP